MLLHSKYGKNGTQVCEYTAWFCSICNWLRVSGNSIISNACQHFQVWWFGFSLHHLTDVEMADGNQNLHSLKPTGGIGKKSKRKFKMGKGKRRGKGIRRKHHIWFHNRYLVIDIFSYCINGFLWLVGNLGTSKIGVFCILILFSRDLSSESCWVTWM
jgi:hypothetical protein